MRKFSQPLEYHFSHCVYFGSPNLSLRMAKGGMYLPVEVVGEGGVGHPQADHLQIGTLQDGGHHLRVLQNLVDLGGEAH